MSCRYYVAFHFERDPNALEVNAPQSGVAGIVLDLPVEVDTVETIGQLAAMIGTQLKLTNCVILGLVKLKSALLEGVNAKPILGPNGGVIGSLGGG